MAGKRVWQFGHFGVSGFTGMPQAVFLQIISFPYGLRRIIFWFFGMTQFLWHFLSCPQVCFVPALQGLHLQLQSPEDQHDRT